MTGTGQLAAVLRREGGLLAGALEREPAADPLVDAAAGDRGLVLAAVREGYRLHYEQGNVVRGDDPDLALLGGDRLYALAVDRLAAEGDLDAVLRLADLISRCAQAHAEEDPAAADAAWRATASILVR